MFWAATQISPDSLFLESQDALNSVTEAFTRRKFTKWIQFWNKNYSFWLHIRKKQQEEKQHWKIWKITECLWLYCLKKQTLTTQTDPHFYSEETFRFMWCFTGWNSPKKSPCQQTETCNTCLNVFMKWSESASNSQNDSKQMFLWRVEAPVMLQIQFQKKKKTWKLWIFGPTVKILCLWLHFKSISFSASVETLNEQFSGADVLQGQTWHSSSSRSQLCFADLRSASLWFSVYCGCSRLLWDQTARTTKTDIQQQFVRFLKESCKLNESDCNARTPPHPPHPSSPPNNGATRQPNICQPDAICPMLNGVTSSQKTKEATEGHGGGGGGRGGIRPFFLEVLWS